ncbi:hypothetical protein J2X56_002118 [Herbaspirillum sp. 1173]|uniref:DUF6396 domain-containing protein n=1 Tax=Herbaspirillum sp. 1173 TaxID=2817734 RepID=UPI0028597E30|nr:DUF6396 domain-containing protein [Herbaspirillum sp. 1173]MDR6740104.1 hypothetical protein [Herbaspirillum sp. 1173]
MSTTQYASTVPLSRAHPRSRGSAQWLLESAQDKDCPIHRCNRLQMLYCGEQAFARICDDIRRAKDSVEIICWGFDPAMELERGTGAWPRGETWGDLLRDVAAGRYNEGKPVQVRLLSWYGVIGSALAHNMPGYQRPSDYELRQGPMRGEASVIRPDAGGMPDPVAVRDRREVFNASWYRAAEACAIPNLSLRVRDGDMRAVWGSLEKEAGKRSFLETAGMVLVATDHQKSILIDYEYEGGAQAVGYVMGLNAVTDYWDNRTIARRMLECGLNQGNAEAAFNLGGASVGDNVEFDQDNDRARIVLQEGLRLGSYLSAIFLASAFRHGDPLSVIGIDKAREDRYRIFSDALQRNPDLRFPNLDKVLPLPPAKLPMWNGDRKTLLEAARAILQKPAGLTPPIPDPAWLRTGRARIPDGQQLPTHPQRQIAPQFETTAAPETGYWQARLMRPITERHRTWNAEQLPLRYEQGELFDRSRAGLQDEDGRIQFHYLGMPVDLLAPPQVVEDPRVRRRVARYAEIPQTERRYRSHSPCPHSGIWRPYLPEDHPKHQSFNRWDRQVYLRKGMPFPDVIRQRPGISEKDLLWQWLGNANEEREGLEHISLDQKSGPASPEGQH